jgi:hypothetical protein
MQTINTRITRQANYKLTQYKKKNKLKHKSEAIEQLLANHSLRSGMAERDKLVISYLKERHEKGHELNTIIESLQAHLQFN